ncbi:MAG TPA: hypothetical protein ENK74_04125 [Nitratifractor sp.]|nr:hypothetical protein [Nitratifractor sp.]
MIKLKTIAILTFAAAFSPVNLFGGSPLPGLNNLGGMKLANSVKYNHPKYKGYNLDWCYIFEHDCGKKVANKYCQTKGHIKATNWVKWNNPGVKTMTIGQNSICDPQYHRCDSFKSISCAVTSKTFTKPKFHGYALDWCKTFAHSCGKSAADSYCKLKGYKKAISFSKWNKLSTQTMTIGETSICDPRFHRCDSFKYIKCSK